MDHLAPLALPARFELDREIGRGGMAIVYRAHDNHLGRFVAIKVLSADLSHTVDTERFQREIALMARLVHPGIVALFDSGQSDGRLYYVMPFVAGETLRARLARERRLTPQAAAALGADIAEALAYAHGMGIVHRDVKPENVFSVDGRAMLADFGIARIVGEPPGSGPEQTTSGLVLGTVSYMSPEQARGEPRIDGRSDLYSLGCVLYELLAGAPPFVAPTALGVLARHMTEAPRPLRECGVAAPEGLEAVVLQLLAKDPGDRPAGAGDVARLLREAAHAVTPASVPAAGARPFSEAVTIGPIDYPDGDAECLPVAQAIGRAVVSSLSSVPGIIVVTDRPRSGETDASLDVTSTTAATVIDGSVRRSRSRMRVTMRVTGPGGVTRWSQHVDGAVDDVFALEDAVSEIVVGHFSMRADDSTRAPSPRPLSAAATDGRRAQPQATMSEADQLVVQALKAFSQFGASGATASRGYLDEARAYLTRALTLEPANARGLCAMGNLLSVEGAYGLAPAQESIKRGRELIYAALAADDRCAEVHCSMGKIALYHDDDFHAAVRHVRRAVELDPADPEAQRLLSIVYKILGRADDAVDAARAATVLAPDVAPLWNALGDALLAAGRNAEAVDVLKRAIGFLPGYGPALERLERAHAALGEFDRALEIRCSRMRLAGHRERADLLETEAAELGAAGAIRQDLRRERDGLLHQAETLDPFLDNVRRNVADRIASTHAELGEWREAMDWVERAYERRPGRLRRMLTDMPVDYRGLAVDPRYARLMRVAGLEDVI